MKTVRRSGAHQTRRHHPIVPDYSLAKVMFAIAIRDDSSQDVCYAILFRRGEEWVAGGRIGRRIREEIVDGRVCVRVLGQVCCRVSGTSVLKEDRPEGLRGAYNQMAVCCRYSAATNPFWDAERPA